MINDVILGSEEEVMAALAEMSVEFAPRRFTVCVISRKDDDAAVIGWGFLFDPEVLVYLPGCVTDDAKSRVMRFPSMDRALFRLARCEGVRIIWLDPEPAAV